METTNQDSNKVKKAFDATMRTLVAIVGGQKNLYPARKISTDTLSIVVDGLLKEEREEKEKEVKEDLKRILKAHAELQRELKNKREELAKLEEKKMKEFTDAAKQVFAKIDELGKRENEYYTALSAASGESSDPEQLPSAE